jgi:hypothetical protein
LPGVTGKWAVRIDHVNSLIGDLVQHSLNLGLAAEFAVAAHLAGHPRHLRGERAELIDHGLESSTVAWFGQA